VTNIAEHVHARSATTQTTATPHVRLTVTAGVTKSAAIVVSAKRVSTERAVTAP
jgi:hypothetical protein